MQVADRRGLHRQLELAIGQQEAVVRRPLQVRAVAGYANAPGSSKARVSGTRARGYDGFAPLGPWLATPAEVNDPRNIGLWLDVNQQRIQDGSTRQMIFGMAALVSYVSGFMSLQPGDIIATGTPSGVGLGRKPPVYLRRGDVVELGADGLGQQTQRIC